MPPPLPFSRILLTGAHGFVGRWLAPELASRLRSGAKLVLAVRAPRDSGLSHGDHEEIPFDLGDASTVRGAIAQVRPDLVIHLAAQSSVGHSHEAAAVTWSSNLCGSLALADALAKTVPECTVLFASSAEVYGVAFNNGAVTERSLLRPSSVYARSKAAAEVMFADVLSADARLIVARPSNHTGPGQDETFVVPSFAAQIARAERGAAATVRVGNLDVERDFLDVRDVVSAYLALLDHAAALPLRNTFNIASGVAIPIGKILTQLCALSTVAISVETDVRRVRVNDVPRTCIDATALHHTVGWSLQHNLDDTLADILNEYRGRNA